MTMITLADSLPPARPYHHGDLKNAIVATARAMLERQKSANISFRAIAREAHVSHTAPYRHFTNRQDMLAEVARGGYLELRDALSAARNHADHRERLSALCRIYMGYIADHPALARLMFETQILTQENRTALREAAGSIGEEIGIALNDTVLGLSLWATLHGIAMLMLENVIDIGTSEAGSHAQITCAQAMLKRLIPEMAD